MRIESAILKDENDYEIPKLTNLKELVIENAPELLSIQSFDNLYRIQKLQIKNAPKLRSLPSFGSFTKIHRLELKNLGITALPDEFGLGSQLFLTDCPNIQTIPPRWCKFSKIEIRDCIDLRSLPKCLLEDKQYKRHISEDGTLSGYPDIIVYGHVSGSPKLQASAEMRKRVQIYTPEEYRDHIEEQQGIDR